MAYEEKYMDMALDLAKKAEQKGEVPVGAVIVIDGKVMAKAYNQREGKADATAHAEILAIKKACKKVKNFRLLGAELYVSLEPCVMCMGAILNARISTVYFGASITGGSIRAKELSERAGLNHTAKVEGGYKQEECSTLISNYFKSKRH